MSRRSVAKTDRGADRAWAGFNPILTGRENIYNKGAILGFTKMEIDKKFDEIVDFAEAE